MSHAPKVAALIAYDEGMLSPAGKARLERHLAGCEVCRRELAAARVYRETASAIREAPVPPARWDRIERAVMREVEAPRTRARLRTGLAVAMAAAVLLAIVVWPRLPGSSRPEVARVEPPEAPLPADERPAPVAALQAEVVAVAGAARSGDHPLSIGDLVPEAGELESATRSELHARIDQLATIALGSSTRITLTELRPPTLSISLEEGVLSSRVSPAVHARGARFQVLAAEHRFVAVGTWFEVELAEGALSLEVAEGTVEVHAPDGSVQVVAAPGRWSREARGDGGELALMAPLEVPAGETWPVLELAHPSVVRWQIGELPLQGEATAALRVRPGSIEIVAWDDRDRALRTIAEVGGDGVSIDADDLVAEPPRLRPGYLPQEDIERVVRGGLPRLRQCYERDLRLHPDIAGRLTVRITVGMDGAVSRARVLGDQGRNPPSVHGAEVPDSLQECVRTESGRWSFPPPQGGPVTFEVPLSFASR